MNHKALPKQSGQSLVLVAVAMIAFLAILGLALDGGYAFSMRRSAQNAADAGALAGVRMLCEPDPLSLDTPVVQAQNAAVLYTNQNDATPTEVTVNESGKRVTVKASIPVDTFFIHLVGIDQIPVEASATAGCFTPTYGRGMLPVAWNCREPVVGWSSTSTGCQQQRITWDTLLDYLDDVPQTVHEEMYIVMDSYSLDQDLVCIEEDPVNGTIHCNLDPGDLTNEIDWMYSSGERSWLDLDGTDPANDCGGTSAEGSAELSEWILGEIECLIPTDTWVPDYDGVSTSLFRDVWDRAATSPLVLVPVFNDLCLDGDPRTEDTCDGTEPPESDPRFLAGDQIYTTTANSAKYFRIDAFALFYITCARRNSSDTCPGAQRLFDLNPSINPSPFKSIEGYFLTGYIPGLGGRDDCTGDDCPDLGVFTYFLSQ